MRKSESRDAAAAPLVLLADDDADDVFFARRALERTGFSHRLFVVRDGEKVVQYLDGIGPFADREKYPLPAVLLLDLKMPKLDGFGVLAWLHAHPEFESLPVFVITGSARESDVTRAIEMGARACLLKPPQAEHLMAIVQERGSGVLRSRGEA